MSITDKHQIVFVLVQTTTKYMIFSYRKLLLLTNIKIGSATTEGTNDIKFLGIIFYKHLHTFKDHADVIARKIFKSVGILLELSKYLPFAIMKTLYYIRINSFLLSGIRCLASEC